MISKYVILSIITSGQSRNNINALETCLELAIPSVVFSGCGSWAVKMTEDYSFVVSGEMTSTFQDINNVLAHSLCECVG